MSVAPPMGKELASTDKITRDKAVKVLRVFLATTGEKPMADLEMAKLWKGIFYCFWLSDKPLVQQELSTSLADLLLVIPTQDASFQFLRGFWQAIVREWPGLDYLRIDKYYMLVRKYVNATFRLLIREEWSPPALAEYTDILTGKGGPLKDRKIPTSIGFHLADIYNEELNKTMSCEPKPPPVPLVPLFKPFFRLDAVSSVSATHPRFQTSLYSPILAALLVHFAPPGKGRNYRSTVASPALSSGESDGPRRKRARIEPPELPLVFICRNARLGDDEDQQKLDGQDNPQETQNSLPLPLPPQKVRKGLLKAMFDIASAADTKEANRKKMYQEWKDATELAEESGSVA